MVKSIAVGLNKGSSLTKRKTKARAGSRKGLASKRRTLISEITREVAGFAPYERRVIELLRNDLDKRALRLAKRRLGSHSRGKAKREELGDVVTRSRQK